MNIEQMKYPIGKFKLPDIITTEIIEKFILVIESFPARLKAEVENLNEEELDTPYRPEGWTIRQVVNHCADSHMNGLIRHKLLLTEDKPTIKPYMEDRWAELADSKTMPIASALLILDGVHKRWTVLLKSLNQDDLKRIYIHPEHGKEFPLEESIALYAWHCNHHLAHITELKKRKNWR
ncbi:MAG: putative metal-dependent hydrolase [Ignavibacteriaceae bacterium]|nr:putative metal-dependent hydrolase [Ignavibacteriaceae bacterium]